MQYRKFSKILSLLLVLCVIFTLIPLSILADIGPQHSSNGNITAEDIIDKPDGEVLTEQGSDLDATNDNSGDMVAENTTDNPSGEELSEGNESGGKETEGNETEGNETEGNETKGIEIDETGGGNEGNNDTNTTDNLSEEEPSGEESTEEEPSEEEPSEEEPSEEESTEEESSEEESTEEEPTEEEPSEEESTEEALETDISEENNILPESSAAPEINTDMEQPMMTEVLLTETVPAEIFEGETTGAQATVDNITYEIIEFAVADANGTVSVAIPILGIGLAVGFVFIKRRRGMVK